MDHWIRVLDPDRPASSEVFATGLAGPVDIATAPDGSLYYLNRKEWVNDERFQKATGVLHKITYGWAKGAPRITGQPADAAAAEGNPVSIALKAEGDGPLHYRWLRDDKLIPGADADNYAIPKPTPADDGGQVSCVVSGPAGSAKSRRATVRVLAWHGALRPTDIEPGLEYRTFAGQWLCPPDFDGLEPATSGTTAVIDLEPLARGAGIGAAWRGFLDVEEDGLYSFFLDAVGASQLFVGQARVALTTGVRWSEVSGHVALKAGKHAFLLLYGQPGGKVDLKVSYAGPGFEKRTIPEGRFSHAVRLPSAPGGSLGGSALTPGERPYGRVSRRLVTTLNIPPDPADLPPLLSHTGIFRSVADLKPNLNLIPYDVNAPLWSDGADKRRWVALPGDARIEFSPAGEWKFPAGTVFVKHFAIHGRQRWNAPARRRREGGGYGVTYKWRTDGKDADLLTDGATEDLTVKGVTGPLAVRWTYPSRNDCHACHTLAAGFVLGVKTRQLNGTFAYPETGLTDNQLRTWSHLECSARHRRRRTSATSIDSRLSVTGSHQSSSGRVPTSTPTAPTATALADSRACSTLVSVCRLPGRTSSTPPSSPPTSACRTQSWWCPARRSSRYFTDG